MAQFIELFRQYETALNGGDTEAIADCYADRFLHLTRRGDSWVHDWRRNNAEFRSILDRAGDWYRKLGARRFSARSLVENKLHPSHSLARVVWAVLNGPGAEIVSFEVTFMVRMREGQGAIVGLVAHNERRRVEESGFSLASADLYFDLPHNDFNAISGMRRSPLGVRETG
ncbi:MAG TPA: hypothetical protein VM686_17110 [Polyangiaceae bacterium]|nr:hypothetical protein [Polyangiaceae bacterium]